jgi:hypothetical protein
MRCLRALEEVERRTQPRLSVWQSRVLMVCTSSSMEEGGERAMSTHTPPAQDEHIPIRWHLRPGGSLAFYCVFDLLNQVISPKSTEEGAKCIANPIVRPDEVALAIAMAPLCFTQKSIQQGTNTDIIVCLCPFWRHFTSGKGWSGAPTVSLRRLPSRGPASAHQQLMSSAIHATHLQDKRRGKRRVRGGMQRERCARALADWARKQRNSWYVPMLFQLCNSYRTAPLLNETPSHAANTHSHDRLSANSNDWE